MPDCVVTGTWLGSGTVCKFVATDPDGNDSLLMDVSDNDAVQELTITGRPTGDAITLSIGGHTTPSIPTNPGDPAAFFRWNYTSLTPGTYDLFVNLFEGGTASHAAHYEVYDGPTPLGTFVLDHGSPSNNAAPVADPVLTQRSTGSGNGVAIKRYKIGRYTFATANLHVRVSCDPVTGSDMLAADNLWVVTTGGSDVARIQPAIPPAEYATGLLPYDNSPQGYQPLGQTPNMFTTSGTGIGTRYLLDPAVVRADLEALPSGGVGNFVVTGNGSVTTPLLVKYRNGMGDEPQAPLGFTPTDGTVAVADVATGGALPAITITRAIGGAVVGPIQLTADDLAWYADNALGVQVGGMMPGVCFRLPQPPPAKEFLVAFQYENSFPAGDWRYRYDGVNPGGGVAGYTGQVMRSVDGFATARFQDFPIKPGSYRVSATWPAVAGYTTDAAYTIDELPGSILSLLKDTGATQTLTYGYAQLAGPRTVAASVSDGTAALVGAVSVVVHGTDVAGDPITETLPAFTAGTLGSVVGSTTFYSITSVVIPGHTAPTGGQVAVMTSLTARVGTYHTDQTAAPSGASDGSDGHSAPFQVLATVAVGPTASGGPFGGLVVTLKNAAGTGTITADALRVERLSEATPSLRVLPGDSVVFSAAAGWLRSQYGPAPAAVNAPMTNHAGGSSLPAPPTTTSMRIGWNMPSQASVLPSRYKDKVRVTDTIATYPTVIRGGFQAGINCGDPGVTYGANRYNYPNVKAGNYVALWDGVNDFTLGNGFHLGAVEDVSRRLYPAPGNVNNRRVYAMNPDDTNYGTSLQGNILGTIIGSGPDYGTDVTNIRIFPDGTDLTSPPKWDETFLSIMEGVGTIRHLETMAGIEGNCTQLADYLQDESRVSRNLPYRQVVIPLAGCTIRQYTGTEWTGFNPEMGVVFEFIFPGAHGLELGQLFKLDGYTGDLATIDDGGSISSYQVADAAAFVWPLADPTRFVSQNRPRGVMTNVITNAGGNLVMRAGIGQPLMDLVEMSNMTGASFHAHTHHANTDACVTGIFTFLAENLAPGIKVHHEFDNEIWNTSSSVFEWAAKNSSIVYGDPGITFVPYYCHKASHHWALARAAWVAAGRDPADHVRSVGCQAAGSGTTTAAFGAYFHAHPSLGVFDEILFDNYLNNYPSYIRGAARPLRFRPFYDSLNAEQLLDLWEYHYLHGGYQYEVRGHLDALTGPDGLGGHARPEFLDVYASAYEGGPALMIVPSREDGPFPYTFTNFGRLTHQVARHPRYRDILIWIFGMYAAQGLRRSNIFLLYGTEGRGLNQWGAYFADGQTWCVPGDPAQDAIQIDQYDRLDLVKSVTGGAVKAFSALFQAPETPAPTSPVPIQTIRAFRNLRAG